jgi:L-ascorbate metabolism protein UlaG (beta-lactamase superfamily)
LSWSKLNLRGLGFSCGTAPASAFFSSFSFSATVTSGCAGILVYHDSPRRTTVLSSLSPKSRGESLPIKRLAKILGALVLAACLGTAVATNGGASFGALSLASRQSRFEASPEWRDGRFQNPQVTGVMKASQSWSVLTEWLTGKQQRVPPGPLPLFGKTAEVLGQPPGTGLRLTWFGHSSTLIELDGVRVLTDPQWSERASPIPFVGPKRFHPPPAPLEALGHLDAVLISHDHYDHLDMRTVQTLAKTGVRFVVPLGIGAHLERWHVPAAQITELDWWQEVPLPGGVRAISVPARHFSGRGLAGNPTLWTSWTLVGPQHRVFYSGDTGLHEQLSAIAAQFGPFDVALLEIGQYHPSWGDIHLGALGALEAFSRLNAHALLPIHWGTFELALHGWSEPAEELVNGAASRQVMVLTPLLGEPIEPARWTPRPPWWREVRAPN